MTGEVPAALLRLIEDTPLLAAALDPFDRFRYANAAFRSAFAMSAGETPIWAELMRRNFGAGLGTVIRTQDFEAWLVSTQSRRGKVGHRAYETDLADGRWLWMSETVRSDGWMLCIASDITSLREDERMVRQARDLAIRASYTDELTGIANRRFVMARIEDMLRAGEAAGVETGCVCLLDLDHFKTVNDRFGHEVGDVILRDFAQRMQSQLRRTDSFGRIGGEEFVLVLPGTTIGQAELIVERMLATARTARPMPSRPDFGYTFSAGLAGAAAGEDADEVLRRADRALYAAKLAGRNRISRYEQPADRAASA